jgi:transposase-like protein
MSTKRRQYGADYKFKVALEAAKGTKTLAKIASHTGIHPNQISRWKGHHRTALAVSQVRGYLPQGLRFSAGTRCWVVCLLSVLQL